MSPEGSKTQIKGRKQTSREEGKEKQAPFLPSSISCLILHVLSTSGEQLEPVNAPNHNTKVTLQMERATEDVFC